MCGIVGFVGPGDRQTLERMTACLTHRGPDDRGHYTDPTLPVFLGHTRLSILDHTGGRQPMVSEDGKRVLVFNGEIYNHRALRQELDHQGHRFRTHHSDTETLLHAWAAWGPAMLDRLNGMWAFVILDRQQGLLFGSRDRMGQKPLYYTHQHGCFAFASELPALLQHPSIPASLSHASIQKYMAFGFFPAPHSPYHRIWKLPAGHAFQWHLNTEDLSTRSWWDFHIEPEPMEREEEEVAEALQERINAAVKRRLVADVPLGVFLSGGIDSSTISALASRHLGPDLQTFSMGFKETSFDESHHAHTMARHLNTRHHHHTADWTAARGQLPLLLQTMDEPLGDSSLLPTWLLCGHARQHVTVVLSGDGADELFAGYAPFLALRKAAWYQRLMPKPLHRAIRLVIAHLPVSHEYMSLDFKLKKTLSGLDFQPPWWAPMWMSSLTPSQWQDIHCCALDPEALFEEALSCWERCPSPHLVDRVLEFFTKLYLPEGVLTKVDRASMLHGLEVRSPFLDVELIDLVRKLPWTFKLRRGHTKYLLRQAASHLLPPSIQKRSKQGFGSPVGDWLKHGHIPMPDPLNFPMLKPHKLQQRIQAHRQGRRDDRLFLYNCLALEPFLQRSRPEP